MDSLFYNTPRPFNKFPTGYRPVNGAAHGSSPSRQFGSMTSLLQAPFDSSNSPLRNNNSSSYASLPHAESSYQPYGISSRGGSVGPYGEPPLIGSGFSSRDPSPARYGYNPVREPTRPVASPPYQQTSPVNQAGDDFLNKLRRQKEEIERAFPRYDSYPEQAPIRESRDIFPDTYRQNENHVNQDSVYQQNEPQNNFVQSSHVPLHKTRSDSHVVRNQIYPSHNGNTVLNGGNDRMSSSFYEDRNNDAGFHNHNRPEKAGFFRRSLHEPNWMTDPPPPIDIAPRMQEIQGNGLQRSNSFIRNSFVEDPRVIPIQLEDDRVLKIIPPQPSNGYHQPQQVPLTVKTTPPYYSRNEEPVHLPNNDVYNDRYYSKPSTDPRANYRAQSQSLPNSPPSTVNHGFNHFAERPTRGTQPMRRERVASPTGFPDIPSSFRDELLSAIPQKSRKSPFTNRQSVLQNNEFEAPFSPVASKIYEGHNRINGFINDRPLAGTFQPMNGGSNHAAVPNRERSFAVVSRPVTPPASLEHVQHFSPPPPLQRPAPQAENERYGRRAFSAPSSIALSNERRTFSPVSSNMSPTDSQPTSRSQMSPMSSLYDNDSETEVFKPRKPFNFSPPPQGILLKNHDAPRPAKKVVFQCDNDAVDRLMRDMRLTTSPVDAPPHVREFDNAVEDLMSQFTALSDQIGGDVAVMKAKVVSTFDALRSFLWTAAGRAEATGDEVQKLVAPIVKHLEEINTFKDSKRNTPQFNHLSAVAEGIPAVGWVLVKKTPGPYVKEMTDAAMFYVNRILKEFKDSDAKQVEWVKTWKEILDSMQKFVRQTHTTGLVWNSAPGSAHSGSAAVRSGPPPPPAGGPPPPPPPPPADLMADVSKASADKAGRDALFAELNKGEKVTAGLRKVTADMQTHKNPNLRGSGTVSAATPSASRGAASGATSAPVKKPAKVELQDGKQWNVEYHVGNKNIIVEIGDKKQTVYVYKCENSVIQVKGKLNSITLDGCKKTSIVFDAVVAQCETINCQSVQIQTLGEMPTLSIQKTDGCQVYLSEAAKNTEIVTSKSSEMNILVPEGPDGEFNEFPVPEQFKTVYSGGKLVTQASDII